MDSVKYELAIVRVHPQYKDRFYQHYIMFETIKEANLKFEEVYNEGEYLRLELVRIIGNYDKIELITTLAQEIKQ